MPLPNHRSVVLVYDGCEDNFELYFETHLQLNVFKFGYCCERALIFCRKQVSDANRLSFKFREQYEHISSH